MNLVATLKSIQKAANELTPHINRGGCGVFAAIVGQELQAIGIPVKIRVFSTEATNERIRGARGNVNTVYDLVKQIGHFQHVVVEFEWRGRAILFDSFTLSVNPKRFIWGEHPLLEEGLTVEDMATMAESPDGWNYLFDHDLIPSLRFLIGAEFLTAKMSA